VTSRPEKAKGVIYGLAIGDALGYQTEFMTLDRIKVQVWPGRNNDPARTGPLL
jgi:ADP-ribosylglycohydrolase